MMLGLFLGLVGIAAARETVVLPNHGPMTGAVLRADLSLNQPIKQDVTKYLGVPFAYPPINELRFAPPKKYEEKWTETRAFTSHAKDCMAGNKGDEDCLYLNVYVPESATTSNPKPVMFWIYGGGFSFGRVVMYDGSALAAQEDVIVVTVSYRFGPLGFFANKATLDEYGTTGNWGILDQRMALQWVNDNIEHFGGDKSKITIFGESAGAISVATHMTSPGSMNLFNNAIVQSGVLDLDLFFLKQEDSFRFYDWMSSNITHCSSSEDMDCLRRIPASRFAIPEYIRDDNEKAPTWAASLFPFFSFGLTIDNNVVFGSPLDQALKGNVAPDINVIVGLTQDEGTIFALASPTIVRPAPSVPPTESDVKIMMEYFMGDSGIVEERFNDEFPHYRARYPGTSTRNWRDVFAADKMAKIEAYRAIHVDNSTYIEVEDQVNELFRREAVNGLFGEEKLKKDIEYIVREFLTRDLANERFSDIVKVSPQIAYLYEMNKGEEGRLNVQSYDRAPFAYLTSAARDIIFSCPALEFAGALKKLGRKVFFYNLEFDVWNGSIFYNVHLKDATGKNGGHVAIADLGTFHGADIPLTFKMFKNRATHPGDIGMFSLFNLFMGNQVTRPGDAMHRVADAMGCYWANLARCGDVNCESSCHGQTLPNWNHLDSDNHVFLNFGPSGELVIKEHQQTGFAGVGANLPTNEQCKKWEQAEFRYLDIKYHNHKQREYVDM